MASDTMVMDFKEVRVQWIGTKFVKKTGKDKPVIQVVKEEDDGKISVYDLSREEPFSDLKQGDKIDCKVRVSAFGDSFYFNVVNYHQALSMAGQAKIAKSKESVI